MHTGKIKTTNMTKRSEKWKTPTTTKHMMQHKNKNMATRNMNINKSTS